MKVGDPYMTLMKFSDPAEQENVLGPLYATAAKAEVPVFGPDGYRSEKTQDLLNAAIKKAVHCLDDAVVDLLAPSGALVGKFATKTEASMAKEAAKLRLSVALHGDEKYPQEVPADKKVFSSRELHDRSHYSVLRSLPGPKAQHEALDHVMLQRAINGYLFNCLDNKAIVADDQWLQGAWDWIHGM